MDTSAGPFKNHTVVFLGSDNGHLLKVLASTQGSNASFSTQMLEDIDVYNPNKSDILFLVLLPSLSSFHLLLLSVLIAHSRFIVRRCVTPPQPQGMLFFSCFLRKQLVNSLRVPLFFLSSSLSEFLSSSSLLLSLSSSLLLLPGLLSNLCSLLLALVLRCDVRGEDRKVLGLELDRDHHALFVAFSSCVIRVPLSRCSDYSSCRK